MFNTTPEWSGELALSLTSVEDLRAMSEVVLTGFLGQPVTLVTKRTGKFMGGEFTMEAKTNLSASVWESVAKELAEAATLLNKLPEWKSGSHFCVLVRTSMSVWHWLNSTSSRTAIVKALAR